MPPIMLRLKYNKFVEYKTATRLVAEHHKIMSMIWVYNYIWGFVAEELVHWNIGFVLNHNYDFSQFQELAPYKMWRIA